MKIAINICVFLGLSALLFGFMSLCLDAAIREQDFNDNIRASRCAKEYTKGYCDYGGEL